MRKHILTITTFILTTLSSTSVWAGSIYNTIKINEPAKIKFKTEITKKVSDIDFAEAIRKNNNKKYPTPALTVEIHGQDLLGNEVDHSNNYFSSREIRIGANELWSDRTDGTLRVRTCDIEESMHNMTISTSVQKRYYGEECPESLPMELGLNNDGMPLYVFPEGIMANTGETNTSCSYEAVLETEDLAEAFEATTPNNSRVSFTILSVGFTGNVRTPRAQINFTLTETRVNPVRDAYNNELSEIVTFEDEGELNMADVAATSNACLNTYKR